MKRLVPEVPTIAWGLLFVVINTFVNIRGIELTAMLNRIALVGELLVLGIFLVMGIWWLATDPMSNGFTLKPFYNEETFSMPLVMGAVSLGCLSFMGFDAISTLSEEAKDAKKGPGRAMIGSLMLVGVLFMAQTYIAGCLCPDGSVFADDPDICRAIFYICRNIICFCQEKFQFQFFIDKNQLPCFFIFHFFTGQSDFLKKLHCLFCHPALGQSKGQISHKSSSFTVIDLISLSFSER